MIWEQFCYLYWSFHFDLYDIFEQYFNYSLRFFGWQLIGLVSSLSSEFDGEGSAKFDLQHFIVSSTVALDLRHAASLRAEVHPGLMQSDFTCYYMLLYQSKM